MLKVCLEKKVSKWWERKRKKNYKGKRKQI